MKCPNCNMDILDSAIICPYCNTQFAFTAPNAFSNQNNLYENVPIENNPVSITSKDNVKDNQLEEEFNPNENLYYSSPTPPEPNQNKNVNNNVEQLNFAGTNVVNLNPIRPEAPLNGPTINVSHYEPKVEIPVNNSGTPPTQEIVNPGGVYNVNSIESPKNLNDLHQTNTPSNSLPPTIRNNNNLLEMVPIQKDKVFFMSVIVIGSIVFLILAFMLILGNNQKNVIAAKKEDIKSSTIVTTTAVKTNNKGSFANYIVPLSVGDIALASLYVPQNDKYYDVDVTGIRFITGIEATQLGEVYNKRPNDRFIYEGFEYNVKLNDLVDISGTPVNPVLDSKIYRSNGIDYYSIEGVSYNMSVQSIYSGSYITNGNEATIKVVYSVPEYADNYSICFGNNKKTLGCFTKK